MEIISDDRRQNRVIIDHTRIRAKTDRRDC